MDETEGDPPDEPAVPGLPPDLVPAPGPISELSLPTPAAQPPEVPPVTPENVNVTQNVVVTKGSTGPGLLVRAVWFIFVGWWLSGWAIGVAYLLCAIIIGLPLGFAIFNRLPTILTLRPRTELRTTTVIDGVTYISGGNVPQRPMWIRAVYFIFVGWWLGAFYLAAAWFLCVILITLPIGLYMFNRVGAVMTLLRY